MLLYLLRYPVIRLTLFGQYFTVYDILKWVYFIDFMSLSVFVFHLYPSVVPDLLPLPLITNTHISKSKYSTFSRSVDNVLLHLHGLWNIDIRSFTSLSVKQYVKNSVIFSIVGRLTLENLYSCGYGSSQIFFMYTV